MRFYSLALLSVVCVSPVASIVAQQMASSNDQTFVAKVSQGGRYEVEASKIAVRKAIAQDVRYVAVSEVHDHELVNAELKKISAAMHVSIVPTLNGEFQGKLDHLKGLAEADFDSTYMEEMATIHDKDEKLFAQEATDGGASEYKAFAAKTDKIVKRHIGALHALDR